MASHRIPQPIPWEGIRKGEGVCVLAIFIIFCSSGESHSPPSSLARPLKFYCLPDNATSQKGHYDPFHPLELKHYC